MKFEEIQNLDQQREGELDSIPEIKEAEDQQAAWKFIEDTNLETITELATREIYEETKAKDLKKTTTAIKKLELDPEEKERKESRKEARKKVIEHLREINEIGKEFDSVYSYFDIPKNAKEEIAPGEYQKINTMEEEVEKVLEERKKGIEYQPQFKFPKIKDIDENRLLEGLQKLDEKADLIESEDDENVISVVLEVIDNYKAKINILVCLKNGDTIGAFNYSKVAYGDIDNSLIDMAKSEYDKKIERLSNENKTDLEKILEKKNFNADKIKEYFEKALTLVDEKDTFQVIVDSNIKAITVDFNNTAYERPVVLIPEDKEVDGKELIRLIAHEICSHAVANRDHAHLFKGLGIGRDWEVVQEGFAAVNEDVAMKEVLGPDYKSGPAVYHVLAMAKAKEYIDRGEVPNIAEMYDYLYGLYEKDLSLGEKVNLPEKDFAKEVDKKTKNMLRRIFRGVFPGYFPKDISYLKGKMIVERMCKSGVDCYESHSKTDPKILPNLIKMGFFSDIKFNRDTTFIKNAINTIWSNSLKGEFKTEDIGQNRNL